MITLLIISVLIWLNLFSRYLDNNNFKCFSIIITSMTLLFWLLFIDIDAVTISDILQNMEKNDPENGFTIIDSIGVFSMLTTVFSIIPALVLIECLDEICHKEKTEDFLLKMSKHLFINGLTFFVVSIITVIC